MENWKPHTHYNEGALVYDPDERRRRCIETHHSTDKFDDKKWKKMDKLSESVEMPNSKFAAITSMNQDYYNHCGRAMLKSFKAHWSNTMPLYVYNEDNFHVKVKSIIPLGWDLGSEYQAFQQRHGNPKIRIFSKKAFSIIHAMENIECDRLIWLDADTVVEKEIPLQLLEMISPDDVLSSHFSVWHSWPTTDNPNRLAHSCETGFFILNKKHPGFKEFYETYKRIYTKDEYSDMRRFYDGEVYGKTVKLLEAKGNKMLDLNPGKHKTPIPRSVVAPYVVHFKAGLKDNLTNEDIEGSREI